MAFFGRSARVAARRTAAGRRQAAGAGAGGLRSDPGASSTLTLDDRPDEVVDITDAAVAAAEAQEAQRQLEEDRRRAAELSERFRARRARAEAEADLRRLRARHWSGERVLEEGRTAIEWWEHPEADPYAVLGLLPGARLEEAAIARRRVAASCHPDRIAADDAAAEEALRRMVAANAAYDRLRRALRSV